VNFIDKKDVLGPQIGEYGRQVAGAFDGGTGGDFYTNSHFGSDDIGESSFSQAGGTIKQRVVQGFTPAFSRGNGDIQVLFYSVLADEIIQAVRPETDVQDRIFTAGLS
jgi:hypothetical protein